MQIEYTRKERFHFYNSLTSIVKALEGQHTIIDLRNESCVSGLIKSVDGFMNVEMQNAVYYNTRGVEYAFETFHISARNIRYVHIPKHLSIEKLMKDVLLKLQGSHDYRKHSTQKKRPNFIKKRAEQYQAEILKSLRNTAGPSSAQDT